MISTTRIFHNFILFFFVATLLLTGCTNSSSSVSQNEIGTIEDTTNTNYEVSSQIVHIPLKETSFDLDSPVYNNITGKTMTYKDVLKYIRQRQSDVPVDLYHFDLTIPQQLDILSISENVEYLWNVIIDDIYINSSDEEVNISEHDIASAKDYTIDDIFRLLPNLKKIDMCNCGYTNDEMAALCDKYTDIRIIWEIHLSHWNIRTDRIAFSTMKDCSQDFFMTDDEAKYFKYCTDLVALDIGHNHVGDISFLKYLPNLRVLILVDNVKAFEGDYIRYTDDLSVLQYLPELRYLEFFVGSVRDLSFLKYTPKIIDLNISYNPVADGSPLFNLPNLQRLMMEHTYIPYDTYVRLTEQYPNAQIEYYGEGSIDHGWREHPRYFMMRDMFNKNYLNDTFK